MLKTDRKIRRIIDANFNRSGEGLRVCEEVMRFVLNSGRLTAELKEIRHAVARIKKESFVRTMDLVESRDAANDVGKCLAARDAAGRSDCADIFKANLERAKESLRVLEEFFKLFDRKSSARFESLRFKLYDIEKKAYKKIESIRNLR
jgi:thiamine-phosphate pyrophosphorylase